MTEMQCIHNDNDALIVKEREEKEVKKAEYLSCMCVQD